MTYWTVTRSHHSFLLIAVGPVFIDFIFFPKVTTKPSPAGASGLINGDGRGGFPGHKGPCRHSPQWPPGHAAKWDQMGNTDGHSVQPNCLCLPCGFSKCFLLSDRDQQWSGAQGMPSPEPGLWTQAPSHTRSMSFVLSYVRVITRRFLLITEVAGAHERNGPDLKGSQPREHPRDDPTQTHGNAQGT